MYEENNDLPVTWDIDIEPVPFSDLGKPVYQKPLTSLFLDPKNITGGSQSILESNSGVVS